MNRYYEDVFSGLNVAFGGEHRFETYEIIAGEDASYSQYTADGQAIMLASQVPAQDFLDLQDPEGHMYSLDLVQKMNWTEGEVV